MRAVRMAAKKVYVTGAQKDAARTLVKRSTASGRFVSADIRKIADARAKVAKTK
jgi:hypothetical protein